MLLGLVFGHLARHVRRVAQVEFGSQRCVAIWLEALQKVSSKFRKTGVVTELRNAVPVFRMESLYGLLEKSDRIRTHVPAVSTFADTVTRPPGRAVWRPAVWPRDRKRCPADLRADAAHRRVRHPKDPQPVSTPCAGLQR